MVRIEDLETIVDRTQNNPVFAEYKELTENISIFEERLAKVKSTKSKFSEKVYKKVSSEYESNIKSYKKKVGPLFEKLNGEMAEFVAQQTQITPMLEQISEKLEELELRFIAGEVDETEYNSKKEEFGPQVKEINDKMAILNENIRVYSDFLGTEPSEIEHVEPTPSPDEEHDHEEGFEEEPEGPAQPVEGASDDLDSWQETSADADEENDDSEDAADDSAEEERDLDQTLEESYEQDLSARSERDENTPAEIDADDLRPHIVVIEGDSEQAEFQLSMDVLTIGRGPDNDIQLANDTSVSRHHSRISYENGEYIITDLDSSNGTFVNGERVTQMPLADNDEVSIGQTILLFKLQDD
ncbi:FHA domain-containing protein [bacterium]|nr:FHA domain-containing protein [bacterium]